MAFYLQSSFVPRYSVFEIQNAEKQADPTKIAVNLMLRINKIVDAINIRRKGIYSDSESASGEVFFPISNNGGRPVYQKSFIDGPLANAGALTIAHGITWTASTLLVGIESYATDTSNVNSIPLPYVDVSSTPVTGNIEIYIDGTNIVITSAGNASSFDMVVVTLRWLQD